MEIGGIVAVLLMLLGKELSKHFIHALFWIGLCMITVAIGQGVFFYRCPYCNCRLDSKARLPRFCSEYGCNLAEKER